MIAFLVVVRLKMLAIYEPRIVERLCDAMGIPSMMDTWLDFFELSRLPRSMFSVSLRVLVSLLRVTLYLLGLRDFILFK